MGIAARLETPLPAHQPDAAVRITLIENRSSRATGPTLLGEGRILDPIALGEPARLAVDGGPVLVTGEVVDLSHLGPETLQVETAQSVYRLDFLGPARP